MYEKLMICVQMCVYIEIDSIYYLCISSGRRKQFFPSKELTPLQVSINNYCILYERLD